MSTRCPAQVKRTPVTGGDGREARAGTWLELDRGRHFDLPCHPRAHALPPLLPRPARHGRGVIALVAAPRRLGIGDRKAPRAADGATRLLATPPAVVSERPQPG